MPAGGLSTMGRPTSLTKVSASSQLCRSLWRAQGRPWRRSSSFICALSRNSSAVAGSGRASVASDWPLSAGRADASRQILQAAGVDADRVYSVAGKAGSDPLYPDDPSLAGNRRIAIVLLREAPVLPTDTSL